MSPGAVTNVCRTTAAAIAVALAACSASPDASGPGALTPAQVEVCKKVERAYREQDPEYPKLRDAAIKDDAVAGWLVRLFIVDLFRSREGRPLGKDQDLMRAAAKIEDPVEARATAEIVTLGAVAVP